MTVWSAGVTTRTGSVPFSCAASDFAQLLGSQKAVFFASDDKGLGHLNIVRTYGYQALRGLLEEAFVPGKAQELLGKTCSA